MRVLIIAALATLLTTKILYADGKKNGFGKDSSSTASSGQGTLGKANANANAGNNGQTTTETTTTTTGPRGQLKNDRTDCNNCNTVTVTEVIDKPGKKR